MGGSKRPDEAAKVPKSSVWEEMHRYFSSRGMIEEQVKIWSKYKERVYGGESSRIGGVGSEGMYSGERTDDDRYRRGAAGSDIST